MQPHDREVRRGQVTTRTFDVPAGSRQSERDTRRHYRDNQEARNPCPHPNILAVRDLRWWRNEQIRAPRRDAGSDL
jgi:hypothetical protein